MVALLLIVATTMAIFGTLGYLKGARWAFIALLILLVAFIAVEKFPEKIISTLNGLYLGVVLVLKGGLGAIASGDLDAAAQLLEETERPFSGDSADLALLLVILGAVGIGLILAAIWRKPNPGLFGLILGLAYGYLLAAALQPLLIDDPANPLPVPLLRPPQGTTTAENAATVAAEASNALDQLFTSLAQPQTIQIIAALLGIAIVLLVLLSVRRGVKGR